jgi:signal transduction histidine kinase
MIKNIISKPEPKVNKQEYFVINSNIFDNLLNNIFSHIKKILDVTIENEVKNKLDLEMKNLNKLISKRVSDLEKEIEEKKVSIKNKISICEDRFNILELLKINNNRVKQRIEKCSFVLKEENAK